MTARQIAKHLVFAVATLLVSPCLLSFRVRAAVMGRDRSLESSTQALALIPGITGQYLRRAFLARTLAACHPTATVEFGTTFSCAGARLDEHVYVGPHCHLGLVHIQRDVMIGAGVHIPSGGRIHGSAATAGALRDQPLNRTLVTIGANAWIGSGAVVMADVGANSIVGAGAVVTRALQADIVAGGVPARVIADRRSDERRA